MLSEESSDGEFWCPLGEQHGSRDAHTDAGLSEAEWASLSRLAAGEWLSDVQIARLAELGLVERVFGQALLTRFGRSTLRIPD